jgi:hypothetical protein
LCLSWLKFERRSQFHTSNYSPNVLKIRVLENGEPTVPLGAKALGFLVGNE